MRPFSLHLTWVKSKHFLNFRRFLRPSEWHTPNIVIMSAWLHTCWCVFCLFMILSVQINTKKNFKKYQHNKFVKCGLCFGAIFTARTIMRSVINGFNCLVFVLPTLYLSCCPAGMSRTARINAYVCCSLTIWEQSMNVK